MKAGLGVQPIHDQNPLKIAKKSKKRKKEMGIGSMLAVLAVQPTQDQNSFNWSLVLILIWNLVFYLVMQVFVMVRVQMCQKVPNITFCL